MNDSCTNTIERIVDTLKRGERVALIFVNETEQMKSPHSNLTFENVAHGEEPELEGVALTLIYFGRGSQSRLPILRSAGEDTIALCATTMNELVRIQLIHEFSYVERVDVFAGAIQFRGSLINAVRSAF